MQKYDRIKTVFGSDLKPRARLVLQCLIYHADKDGMCFPALKTIAAECGYGLTTVKTALKELCEAGYIRKEARFDERKNGGQTSNLYSLYHNITQEQFFRKLKTLLNLSFLYNHQTYLKIYISNII